jgi:UDP-2,3-diacylglucosamine pyrophosphatase LpxH
MEANDTSIIICGHTHIQNKIENNGKVILNPGAVGVPLYSNGKTQFLILHGINHKWEEEFVTLEYDVEAVIDELHTSKLDEHAPYWCIVTENLLRYGKISHATVLSKAMSLCKNETGSCIWPNVPEKYWARAIENIYQIEAEKK